MNMKPLDPTDLNMKDVMTVMAVQHNAAAKPHDPEREAFDKWWNEKASEPLNYRDIQHYAWAAWVAGAAYTINEVSNQVASLQKKG